MKVKTKVKAGRKQKALVLAAFGIYLAGLCCYWLKSDRAASSGNPGLRSEKSAHQQQVPSGNPHAAFSFGPAPSQMPSGFDYQGNRTPRDESVEVLVNSSPINPEASRPINELNVSGASRTSDELVQEVTAKSQSKSEVFSQVHGLAQRHPDAKIREQAVTYLAELGNDVSINYLIEAVIDPEPRVRERALESLSKLGTRVPVQTLVDLAARQGDAGLRAQVAALVQQLSERTEVPQSSEGFQK
jgi:hypothetical protein